MLVEAAATDWDGAPLDLAQSAGAAMGDTPNGSMMLAYLNLSKRNSAGSLAWTSGGGQPHYLAVPALAVYPNVLVHNWGGNNLNLTNVSIGSDTTIRIAGYGPGIGAAPATLPVGSPGVQLRPGGTAQGTTSGNAMRLNFRLDAGVPAVFGFIGGPVDAQGNNAYAIAINSSFGNTGPGTGATAPAGYFATSSGNSWSYVFQWPSSVLYVAYFGAATVVPPMDPSWGGSDSLPTITLIGL